jgi:hypothetical protein
MSAPKAMAPLRRRAMPGMSTPTPRVDTPPEPARTDSPPPEASEPSPPRPTPTGGPALLKDGERPARRRSQDYGATRRPSLTEVIIGLLEEGPSTVEETAAVIRRKRAGEYDEDGER